MGKKILVTEHQLEKLVNYISEEAAGYDDFDQMLQHGGKSMSILIDTLKDLMTVFRGITEMTSSKTIEYIDLKENLKEAIDLISEINSVSKTVLQDFTDKEVIKISEILHRKLESYQEKIRMLINMGEDIFSKENVKSKLEEMTTIVLEWVESYAYALKDADTKFRKRLRKGKPFQRPDMN